MNSFGGLRRNGEGKAAAAGGRVVAVGTTAVRALETAAQPDGKVRPFQGDTRLFLVPGMGHCGGGDRTLDNFDMVSALVNWVEKGQAPDQVIAKGVSAPGETRPLCPYPTHTQYNGSGDPKVAASYRCAQ